MLGVGDVERRDPEDDLAGDAQRLAAGGEDREARGGAQQGVRKPRGRCQQVLAVVDDEQQRAGTEELDHRVDEVLVRQRPDVECCRDRVGNQPRVRDRGQLDQGGATRVGPLEGAG